MSETPWGSAIVAPDRRHCYRCGRPTARLPNANNQVGSMFAVNEVNILNWKTDFKVRLHEGTPPNYANGFAFVIQALSPNVVGVGGQGLGYQGISNSVLIKFDTYTNGSENGTGGSTGLFYGGDLPTTAPSPGEVNLPLDTTMVNLDSHAVDRLFADYSARVGPDQGAG